MVILAIVMTRQATNVHFERKALKCALFTKDSSPSFCLTVSLICHLDFYSLSRAVNCEEFPWLVNWMKWQCLFSLSNSTSVTFDDTPIQLSVRTTAFYNYLATSSQCMLQYPNKVLNTSIVNILKYYYQYSLSNNTGPVSVFYRNT